jgi:hypothetical protein
MRAEAKVSTTLREAFRASLHLQTSGARSFPSIPFVWNQDLERIGPALYQNKPLSGVRIVHMFRFI